MKASLRDFPSGTVVRTQHLHCRVHGFDPRLKNEILHATQAKKDRTI